MSSISATLPGLFEQLSFNCYVVYLLVHHSLVYCTAKFDLRSWIALNSYYPGKAKAVEGRSHGGGMVILRLNWYNDHRVQLIPPSSFTSVPLLLNRGALIATVT